MNERLALARCEVCFWIGDHPEIPCATIDVHDGKMLVMLGTRTTHVVVEIHGRDITSDNQYSAREKLDRALGWLSTLAPKEEKLCW